MEFAAHPDIRKMPKKKAWKIIFFVFEERVREREGMTFATGWKGVNDIIHLREDFFLTLIFFVQRLSKYNRDKPLFKDH